MAKPVLERLQLAGMVGVWGVAVVALVQLAAILVLIALPSTVDVAIREPLRLVVAVGAVAIMAILAALYLLVIRPNNREWRRLVERADERRQRFASIFGEHPDCIAVYNIDGTIRRGNPAAARMLGYGADLVGKSWREHVTAEASDIVDKHFQFACAGMVATFETTFLASSGEEIAVHCYLVPTIVNGEVLSIVGTARDLRDIKRAQEKEKLQAARVAALANIKSEFASHPQEQIQQILEFTKQTLGMQEAAVSFIAGDVLRVAYSATHAVPVGLTIAVAKTFGRHVYGSREILAITDTADEAWKSDPAVLSQPWRSYIGTTIYVESQPAGIISFTQRQPRSEMFAKTDRDFVRIAAALVGSSLERIRNEALLAREAHYDGVTGLANRAYFEEEMQRAIARAKRQGGYVRVHFIDLDGFKEVNDTLGHAAGDDVLRIISTRFRALVREEDLVARLGGDEFVILEWTHNDEGDSTALGDRIVAASSEMMYIGSRIVRVGASVGVAAYPRHADDEVALLRCADSAMYAAKTAGKGAVKLYSYG